MLQSRSNVTSLSATWSLTHQIDEVARTLLLLKAWRLGYLLLAVFLLFSGAYVSLVLSRCNLDSESELRFYLNVDLTTSWSLLNDKTASEGHSLQLVTEPKINWKTRSMNLQCSAEIRVCMERLFRAMNGSDRLLEGLAKARKNPLMLECFTGLNSIGNPSKLACSLLYQPIGPRASQKLSSFKELNLFGIRIVKRGAAKSGRVRFFEVQNWISAPQNSPIKCSMNNRLFRAVATVSFSIATMAAILYFTMSTAFCINQLKLHGFLQKQYQSGLCALAYWLPLLVITAAECLLLSVVFMVGHAIRCPDMLHSFHRTSLVFVTFAMHCGSLALLAILSATVQIRFGETCSLMLLLNLALIGGFAYAPGLIHNGNVATLYLYPPINSLQLIESHIAADGIELMSHEEKVHHNRVFSWVLLTPAFLAGLIIYLDFILPKGNGLRLPLYFPFSRRFWLSGATNSAIESARADGTHDQQQAAFVQPMPSSLVPSVVVDRLTAAYNSCQGVHVGCSRNAKSVLKQISCKIYPGHITWLLGGAGSGKSTLLRILSGFPHQRDFPVAVSGSVTLFNGFQPAEPLDRLRVRRKVAASLGGIINDDLCTCISVRQTLSIVLASRGNFGGTAATGAPHELLSRLGLAGVEDQTPLDLSQGQRKLLSLAMTLAGCAQLILLDEPTKGLEAAARQRVWRLLREICKQSASVSIVVAVTRRDLPTVAPRESIVYLTGGRVAGIGTSQYLVQEFDCNRRCITVTMLPPKQLASAADSTAAAAAATAAMVQKLLNRLPKGVIEHSMRKYRLRLLVMPDALLACVKALELSVGELVAKDGIYLGPTQTLRPPKGAILAGPHVTSRSTSGSVISESSNSNNNSHSFSTSDSSSEIDSTPFQPRNNSRVPQIAKRLPRDKLSASIFHRLFALSKIHAKRVFRSKFDLLTRCVVPILLLASFSVSAAVEKTLYGAKFSTAGRANSTEVTIRTVCVLDAAEILHYALKFDECSATNALLMRKPTTSSLLEFLTQESSLKNIRPFCFGAGQACLFVYSALWNRHEKYNVNRSVSIVLLDNNGSALAIDHQRPYIYRSAVAKVSNHFRARLNLSSPKLTFPIEHPSTWLQQEHLIIMLVAMFSLFPASFFYQVAEDIGTGVYKYMECLGVSRLSYWMNTLFIHWVQYGLFFVLSVAGLKGWETDHNTFYYGCICLPALLFGTVSNLLSVYTTVAVTGRWSSTMVIAYLALVLMAPWTLVGVSRLGYIPVLALIWLMPQVAPLALILYGTQLASQRIVFSSEQHETVLYQLWDMQENFWNYILVINSLLAMPIQIVILCLVLASSACDFRRCIGQHFQCMASPFRWRRRTVDREMQPLSHRPRQPSSKQLCVVDVHNLWKTCPASGFPVVKGISFRLSEGQCLTMVGADGSGKSVTAAIVAGQMAPTSGSCRIFCRGGLCLIGGEPWRHRPSCGAVGYCPNYSPLYDWLTVMEHLQFYAALRGLNFELANKRIPELITELGLTDCQKILIGRLDNHRCRLVTLATALLSRPLLLIIDNDCLGEARHFWRQHSKRLAVNESNPNPWRLAILATADYIRGRKEPRISTASDEDELDSSDEENDAFIGGEARLTRKSALSAINGVADVFGLLHRGRMVAMGTPEELAEIYGSWYILDITLVTDSALITKSELKEKKIEVTQALLFRFKGSLLMEKFRGWMQFCLPAGTIGRLSDTLRWLDNTLTVQRFVQRFCLYSMPLDQAIALQHLSIIRRAVTSDEDDQA